MLRFSGIASVLCCAGLLVACGGGNSGKPIVRVPPPTMMVELPTGHDLLTALAAGGRTVTIQAGETEDVGGVRFSCPSGGSACTVTLTVDGSVVSAVSTGGTAIAALVPPPPPPDDDVQLAGPAVLEATGTARRIGMATYAVSNIGGRFPGTFAGQRPIHRFDDWGLWAKVGEETLFRVAIRPDDSIFADSEYELHVEGTPSGSNPASGSAVWLGGVRAYDAHPDTLGTPVSGDARIEANLSAATVDVSFTNFTGGHVDMSWQDLAITSGAFRYQSGYNTIDGSFYGAEHQGVAGKFTRDRLNGVFGAVRE